MIFPSLRIQLWKPVGTDVYGQPRFFRLADEKVAPVKLEFRSQHTTVRTDSASSHGHAYEETATVVFLALPLTKITIGFKLVVNDHTVRVVEMRERFSSAGRFDHYEVHCDAWK